jgi:nicotinamidase-related amidase
VQLSSSVLVVIDMQNGFVRPSSAHVVPAVVRLVDRWQAAGGATVFTRFINYPGSPYERLIGWSRVAEAPETDLVDDVRPYAARATATVDKTGYTLFTDNGAQVIADGGWSDLVFCGLTTESCVCKSAVDAFERNLSPWVVTDACGSHGGPEAHNAGLLVLRRFIGQGQMITSADVSQLLNDPASVERDGSLRGPSAVA